MEQFKPYNKKEEKNKKGHFGIFKIALVIVILLALILLLFTDLGFYLMVLIHFAMGGSGW